MDINKLNMTSGMNTVIISNTIPIHVHEGANNIIVQVKDNVVHVYPFTEEKKNELLNPQEPESFTSSDSGCVSFSIDMLKK